VINPESTLSPKTLTDKRRPDLYHTCNNLSGLSIAQHPQTHSRATVESNRSSFDTTKGLPAIKPTTPGGGWRNEQERQEVRKEIWANALGWIDNGPEIVLGGKASRLVCPLSPEVNGG
jgi:protein farnesyltransferase subunit beta